jgi:hypothetical protein
VARSGFYAWRQRQEAPGMRAAENAVITAEIEAVFQEHRGFYGSPRIHQELPACADATWAATGWPGSCDGPSSGPGPARVQGLFQGQPW